MNKVYFLFIRKYCSKCENVQNEVQISMKFQNLNLKLNLDAEFFPESKFAFENEIQTIEVLVIRSFQNLPLLQLSTNLIT